MPFDELLLYKNCILYLEKRYPKILRLVIHKYGYSSISTRYQKVRVDMNYPNIVIFEPRHGFHGLMLWVRDKFHKMGDREERILKRFSEKNYRCEFIEGDFEKFIFVIDKYLGGE